MRDRKGFTLIELLIVVVIIGILAAIAIPRFTATRERAYVAAMKSDLRNLANQQELYFGIHFEYADNEDDPELAWDRSSRVVVVSVNGTAVGWNATVRHPGMSTPPGDQCYIWFGEGPELNAPQPAGVVGCDGEDFEVPAT